MRQSKSKENDVSHCCKKDIEKIKEKLPALLGNSVLKEFLEEGQNRKDFYEMVNNQDELSLRKLDKQFKEFYRINRIVRYISGLIKRYPIDYDKRVKLRNKRYQLILDKPVNNGKDDSAICMRDMISDRKIEPDDLLIEKEEHKNLFFDTKNPFLYEALKKLGLKQKEILYLYYEKDFNNKEIGERFGQTEQNISYWHKKTIKELQQYMAIN